MSMSDVCESTIVDMVELAQQKFADACVRDESPTKVIYGVVDQSYRAGQKDERERLIGLMEAVLPKDHALLETVRRGDHWRKRSQVLAATKRR